LQQRPFLLGEHFSAADAYLFVVSQWAKYVDLDLSGLVFLQAFLQRVSDRPAVKAALKAEGLLG
jgi:glutathione S-transferase